MPFEQSKVRVETSDGHVFTLLESFSYVTKAGERIVVPAGAQSDGASTPDAIWNIIPPFGKHWMPALLHDWLYRKCLRPKHECDLIFLEAMESNGVSLAERETIYQAVRFCGGKAFAEDRKEQAAT